MKTEKISEFISCIITAVSGCSLYSEKHEIVTIFAEKALNIIDDIFIDDSLSFIILGDSLLINNQPYSEKGIHIDGFIRKLKRKKIEKIVFRKKPDIEEFRKFVVSFASRELVLSSPNISVGILDVGFKAEGMEFAALLAESTSKVKEAFEGVPRLKTLDMVSLEDAVIDFVAILKKEINVLRTISPIKSHDEYTHVHASNVSVLTMFQAESIGLKGESIHDIGLAGLLHDVGKVFISTSLLDKKNSLDESEWVEMQKHPGYGALYLSKLQNVPPVAAIAAFEHHMKFDGSGYPKPARYKKQHIISQMVAIADFFDALRTERSYRKSLDLKTIIDSLKEGAGKAFNPLLVDNFISAIGNITDGRFT